VYSLGLSDWITLGYIDNPFRAERKVVTRLGELAQWNTMDMGLNFDDLVFTP